MKEPTKKAADMSAVVFLPITPTKSAIAERQIPFAASVNAIACPKGSPISMSGFKNNTSSPVQRYIGSPTVTAASSPRIFELKYLTTTMGGR